MEMQELSVVFAMTRQKEVLGQILQGLRAPTLRILLHMK